MKRQQNKTKTNCLFWICVFGLVRVNFCKNCKLLGTENIMSDSQKKVGNILSNISPPSELPSFVTAGVPQQSVVPEDTAQQKAEMEEEQSPKRSNPESDPFIPTTFSPAIPSNKDTSTVATAAEPESTEKSEGGSSRMGKDFASMVLNAEPLSEALSPITQGGSTLFGWMKGAVSNNGLLHKVAEKAKSSVDTIVTTLDPQMEEYISWDRYRNLVGVFY